MIGGMPVEFTQTAVPQGSTDNELYKLEMKYDGSGRRISKTVWRKAVGAENWQKKQVTHYTGIGTEIRENYHNESLEKAKVVVNMPQGLGRSNTFSHDVTNYLESFEMPAEMIPVSCPDMPEIDVPADNTNVDVEY